MATSTLGSGTLVLAGTTSGTTTVTATAVAGTTTLTLPAATDTLVGKATTDTLTNKTLTSPTITGGALNGTVGATTPATGAFTTLSASGNVTLGDASTDTLNVGNGDLVKDASGNLGIGTTSPQTKLHVANTGYSGSSAPYGAVSLVVGGATADSNWGHLVVSQASTSNGAGGKILFSYGSTIDTDLSPFAAITGSKQGANYGDLLFFTRPSGGSNTERARIDSSGNLLVGITGATNKRIAANVGDSTSNTVIYAASETSYTGGHFLAASATAASTGWYHFVGQSSGGTNNILIFGNGNIQNANNSYGAISDAKLKENIVDATPKLEKLMQVRIRNYNLKGEYEQHKQLGVVAQELEQVFPSMVEESPDKDADGNDLGTVTKSVKYSVFVPMLIKAMQEQQALITQLTDRITALEGA